MKVKQLVELLQQMDPELEVVLTLGEGSSAYVQEVQQGTERCEFDQDFDRAIVILTA